MKIMDHILSYFYSFIAYSNQCCTEDLCELLLYIVYNIIDLETHEVGVTLKKDLSCFYLYFQGFLSRNNKEWLILCQIRISVRFLRNKVGRPAGLSISHKTCLMVSYYLEWNNFISIIHFCVLVFVLTFYYLTSLLFILLYGIVSKVPFYRLYLFILTHI